MKITLDTNVLVSAFISKRGHPAHLLDLLLTFPELELVLSEPILNELRSVMSRQEVRERFNYAISDVEELVGNLEKVAICIQIKSNHKVVKEDPKDDVIVNTAYDGKVDFIVSGDKHLLKLKIFKGVKIVSPRRMMKIIAERFGEIIILKDIVEE